MIPNHARPRTVTPSQPDPPDGYGWEKDVAHYTEPLTPFGWSVLEPIEAAAIARTFPQVGLIMKRFDQRFVGGEIYTRPVLVVGPADPGPKPGGPPPAVVLGIAARLLPPLRRRNAAARRALATDLPQRWQNRWPSEWRPHFITRAAELRAIDLAALDDDELLAHLQLCVAHATHGGDVHFKLMIGYVFALHALHRFTATHLGWDDARTTTLLAGASPASAEAELAMGAIRSRIVDLDEATEAVLDTPDDPVGALGRLDARLGEALAEWVEAFGWRSMNYDPGRPVLAEQPHMVTRLLLAAPVNRHGDTASAAIADARAALDPSLADTFDGLVKRARALYPVREDNVAWTDGVPGGLLRRWLLEAAGRLVDRGLIDHVGDGAYLTTNELRDAVAGASAEDLMTRVVRRRGEEAYVRANPGPLVIGAAPGPMPDLSALPAPLRTVNEALLWFVGLEYPGDTQVVAGSALLSGIGASPGVAEGPARIIRRQSDFGRMEVGDVLVCQVTSPAWTALFGLAAAVVADGGGALSHAAIAAREHGLPAVLGTRSATTTLADGQLVRVDGARGTVTLVPDRAASS